MIMDYRIIQNTIKTKQTSIYGIEFMYGILYALFIVYLLCSGID